MACLTGGKVTNCELKYVFSCQLPLTIKVRMFSCTSVYTCTEHGIYQLSQIIWHGSQKKIQFPGLPDGLSNLPNMEKNTLGLNLGTFKGY